mmetsp:Transcript_41743/g.108106  ORF Transcript_41743/g.108106 Transcript_41743/m.108106 type:complete len:254 (+) Transcript_41743:769-1530(+)
MMFDMSTSWKVVSIAAVFCDSLSVRAMVFLMRVIFTRRSSRDGPAATALVSVAAAGAGVGALAGAAGSGAAAGLGASAFGAALGGASPPGLNLAKGWPTCTVSSGCARISMSVPFSLALTSTLTLSVSMTAMTSPSAQKSPAFFCHSCNVPSVMLSAPNSGVAIVLTSPAEEKPLAVVHEVGRQVRIAVRAAAGFPAATGTRDLQAARAAHPRSPEGRTEAMPRVAARRTAPNIMAADAAPSGSNNALSLATA